jgi:hypothetical protein
MSDEGIKNKPGFVSWPSNTPLPKLHKGKCPAKTSGVPCMGELCRFKLKGCAYRVLRSDMIAGRQAVRRLKNEGFEVI